LGLTRLVDRNHIRVIERRRQTRLPEEPGTKALVLGQLRRQQLQRHLAIQRQVVRPIHHAHTAPPEQRLQAITEQLRADSRSEGDGPSTSLHRRIRPAPSRQPLRNPREGAEKKRALEEAPLSRSYSTVSRLVGRRPVVDGSPTRPVTGASPSRPE